ncbi:hypothetical protein Tco_0407348 [Tanacetum coccineum]
MPSDIQHSAAYSDLRVLQIGTRAKVIENQQSCLLLHQLSHTLLSTPTLSPAEPSRKPMIGRFSEDLFPTKGTELLSQLHLLTDITIEAKDYRRALNFHIPSTEKRRELPNVHSPTCHSSPPLLPSPLYYRHLWDKILRVLCSLAKRLCLSTLGSRYEVGESSTARPTRGRGIDYGFVSTVDAEERRQGIRDVGYGIRDTWVDPAEAVPEIAPMTVGEVNTRVTELAELHEHDTQDLYALLEDAQDSRSRISQRVDMDSQRVDLLMGDRMTLQETVWMVEEEAYASREAWAHSIGLSQATYQELQTHRDHVYAHKTHIQAHQTQLQLQGTLIQTQHQIHKTRFQMQ